MKHMRNTRTAKDIRLSKEEALSSLRTRIPQLFNDAQKPNANQRLYARILRQIQEPCSLMSERQIGCPEIIDVEGEEMFIKECLRNINKIIPIKKKEPHADRIVRFVASFLLYLQEKDEEEKQKDREASRVAATDMDDTDEEEFETISSRFVERLLRHLLRGFKAKSISVRLRCCQIVALSISSMGEIDENLYQDLRTSLFERIKDRDASVRIQAVTALCRLQGSDKDVDPSDGKTILEKLMWALQYDTSSELRRVILFNIDVNEETLPYIVERVRDVDPLNRRVVYLKPLSEMSDYKLLSLDDRHKILDWGLNDRDALVRKAARKMLSAHWIRHANNNLIEFLESLEIMKRNVGEGILNAIFTERMDIVAEIKFDAEFWKNLTPESAFLANVFIHFLQKTETLDERLDTVLPELTRHAFNLEYYNQLYLSDNEHSAEYEYITSQMLDISLYLDYADEVGRRKMFELLREMLKVLEIPDAHLSRIVKIFRVLSIDERDFTRTMIEIISDIQEQNNAESSDENTNKRPKLTIDDSADSTTSTDKVEGIITKLRCLNICKCMLENSQESLKENSSLYGLLNDLVVPAVQNTEFILRETGLHCLGLYCTLDKTLAQHNVTLFLHCIKNGHDSLQKLALMILFDLIITYGIPTLCEISSNMDEMKELFEFTLDHDEPDIQRIATEGLTKLMLTKRFKDEEILRLLILLYFFPTSPDIDNSKIQQCLTYFFPAFFFSSSDNQKLLTNIVIPALDELVDIYTDLEEDEEMVSPTQIASMLADWVDPRKLAKLQISVDDHKADMGLPAQLAITTLENILTETGVIKRKVMCQFLTKLYIEEASEDHLRKMMSLFHQINASGSVKEAIIRNLLLKVEHTIDALLKNHTASESAVDTTQMNNHTDVNQSQGTKESFKRLENVVIEALESDHTHDSEVEPTLTHKDTPNQVDAEDEDHDVEEIHDEFKSDIEDSEHESGRKEESDQEESSKDSDHAESSDDDSSRDE